MSTPSFDEKMYECRVQLLLAQATGMWHRFNFFLTISLALSAAFFLKELASELVAVLPKLGALVSFVWFVVGAGDSYFYMEYRCRVDDLERHFSAKDPEMNRRTLRKHPITVKMRPWRFVIPHFGVTPLACVVPIMFAVFWLCFWKGR